MENKTTKYFKYAIGEIVLVVIGILIALQINNWNIKRLDHDKEHKYLKEITNNLKSDLLKIQSVIDFNQNKDSMITESIQLLDIKKTVPGPLIFGPRLDTLGSYDKFRPNDLGFKNLISADNISLIENDSLRKLLLEYYSFDFETGVKKRAEELTRKFVDYLLPRITTKEHFLNRSNVELDLPSNNEVHLKNDQQLIAYLQLMQVVGRIQNELLTFKKEEIGTLIENVLYELNSDND